MNEIKIFENPAFGKIRTAGTSDKPLFCLADVCKILEIGNTSDVAKRLSAPHLCTIEVGVVTGKKADGTDATQNISMIFVEESNLYRCIFQSRKAQAEIFQDWIFEDVIPTIRKTGSYGLPQTFAEALRLAADQQEQLELQQKQLNEQKPKVEFFDAVAESKTAIEMKAVANTLHFKNIGRNKLFAILREKKILMGNNMPYQKYVDCGYFRTVEQKFSTPDGEVRVSIKTIVYQKGVDFIRKTLKGMGYKEAETNE